jgi:type IV pilus assembly protein PilN
MKGAVSINLASEPFRRDRPFVVACVAGATALGALLAYQVSIGLIERGERAGISEQVAQASGQLARLRGDTDKVNAEIRDPRNAEAIDYAIFLNGLLMRKGISWTRIFSDLEQVMPHDVRLIAVRPQVNTDNQIVLDMTVGSQTPDPVVNMVMRLEASPLFGATAVKTWLPPSQAETLYRYSVTANYGPKL